MDELDTRYHESDLEIRSVDGKTTLEGLANPAYDGTTLTEYKIADREIERFAKGAFDDYLRDKPEIEIRYNHDKEKVIAVTPSSAEVWSDAKGLHYRAEIDEGISYNKDLVKQVSRRIMRGSSMRFGILESRWSKEGENNVRTITKAYVVECSPVFRPAYKASTLYLRDRDNWLAQELTAEKEKRLQQILDTLNAPSGDKDTTHS